MRPIRSIPLRYGLALGAFALIVASSYAIRFLFGFNFDPTSLIIILMIASAWYLGIGPGLLVAVAFEVMLNFFSTAPWSVRAAIIIFNRLVLFSSVVWFASSRRSSEKRLKEQREWLRVTLSSIGEAVIATDTKGAVIFINPTAEALTGWNQADAAGKPLHEVFQLIDEETRRPFADPFATIERDGATTEIGKHRILITKDGREVSVEDHGSPIRDAEQKTIGVIVAFHDISERRRAEQERTRLLESERAARSQAEASDRLKDEFLATVSHELRTPLSAILGWSSMLNLGTLSEETARNATSIIERNARAQAKIISDILDVSRITTGKLNIESRPVQIAPIIQSAIDTLQLAASARAIRINLSLDVPDGVVAGDPARLQQIIWNLVSNAIKFTPENGQIEVRLERASSHLEVIVSDNGIGIKPEFLPHVFERFRQGDSSTTRAHGGLGLGLALVRHLVELHGGTVSAESDGAGKGSRFRVSLPLSPLREGQLPGTVANTIPESVEPAKKGTPDLSGYRVLVVDDERDTLDVLCVMLNQFGASVRAASSTTDALQAFEEWRPDVLLSDLGMPGEDGYVLIEKIRALAAESGGNIPAAALTAHVRNEDRVRALAAGYQIHIRKPVDPATLASTVATLANGRKRE